MLINFSLSRDTKFLGVDRIFSTEKSLVRDFYKYECADARRIGKNNKKSDPLYRIEGGWFVCFDKGLEPIENRCNILSFGINTDYSFDEMIHDVYKCRIESFDPYYEAQKFQILRNETDSNRNAMTLTVESNPLWRFHRIGIVGPERVNNRNQIGWLATLEDILKYTQLENKVIDVFKMDIEHADYNVLNSLNTDYLCRNVKQFMIETHPILKNSLYSYKHTLKMLNVLRKLEQCFLLFRRDTRFFLEFSSDLDGNGAKTEFQKPITFKLDLNHFSNEIELINYVVTYGELYFVNSNFL